MSNLANINLAYGQRANAYRSQNAAELARNAYSRFLAQQRGDRALYDIRQQTERRAPKLVSGYSRRGLAGPGVQSGIYQKALSDFARENFEALNRAQQDINQELTGLDFEKRSMEADLQNRLAQLEMDKQRQIAEAAAALTNLRPLIGG